MTPTAVGLGDVEEGAGVNLIATTVGHLLDVPAALMTWAVRFHQFDRDGSAVARLDNSADQPPKQIAALAVAVAACNTSGDKRQCLCNLLECAFPLPFPDGGWLWAG